MLALLAALLLSTARAATPEAGVQEDASIAIETPAKVVRHFDGSLRIGYADPLDLGQGSSFMESLAARLEESLRGAGKGGADVSVTLHKYAPFDLQTAVVSHEVDLFLVTSGYYIYLSDMGAGVEWISTLKPPQATDPERAAGSVFVVRADDTRYNQVSDLRTAFVAAAGMASFDGWITALDEVANVSQYPKNFFGKTTFLGASGLSVARAVLERDADVGILRVCELETLTAAGLVEPGSLRVVGEKPQQGLACVSSTELFPGLALAAQTYVPEDVRRRIAAAVYSMPVPESGYRWTLANDYRNVRRVAEKFAYAPTNKASDARFSVVEELTKSASPPNSSTSATRPAAVSSPRTSRALKSSTSCSTPISTRSTLMAPSPSVRSASRTARSTARAAPTARPASSPSSTPSRTPARKTSTVSPSPSATTPTKK